MKKIACFAISFLLIGLPVQSFAQQRKEITPQRAAYCMQYATALMVAMGYRDMGYGPKVAFHQIDVGTLISQADKKRIVNAAFFDKEIARISSGNTALQGRVEMLCENNWKPLHNYQPLK